MQMRAYCEGFNPMLEYCVPDLAPESYMNGRRQSGDCITFVNASLAQARHDSFLFTFHHCERGSLVSQQLMALYFYTAT